jgi:hypothetical protein
LDVSIIRIGRAFIPDWTAWSGDDHSLYHYRDKDQDEVDVVIEDAEGAIVGLEVKAAATVIAADFKGPRKLAAASDGKFRLGAVIHAGDTVVPFGSGLFAAPYPCLWARAAAPALGV